MTKGPTALTPEIDCDQAAMGLRFVTSVVFLIASLGGISQMPLLFFLGLSDSL
jgi:hypothetical protein